MNNIIVLYENYTIYTDDNMGYIFELKECKYLKTNGEIGLLNDKEAIEQANNIEIQNESEDGVVLDTTSSYPLAKGIVKDNGNKFNKS